MNLSLFLSFLLATVAITAAAPIVEEDTTDVFNATTQQLLEKRAHYGWISSFAPDDTDCKRGWAPPRPKLIGDRCIKYHPYGPNVGIHWGSVCLFPHSSYPVVHKHFPLSVLFRLYREGM